MSVGEIMSDTSNKDPLVALLKTVVKDAVREVLTETAPRPADDVAGKLAGINSKPYITVPEAQLLLGCSDSLLYKHIKDARRGKTERPIPFLDIGIYIFPREPLLSWAHGHNAHASEATGTDTHHAA
jgi:hypothetical protein